MPADLGLDGQHDAPHDRRRQHVNVALVLQAPQVGRDLSAADRQLLPSRLEHPPQLLAVHAIGREGECDAERVGPGHQRPDRLLPQRRELDVPVARDLVHGPFRPPAHLLGAQRLDEPFALHRAQLPVQRPDADPAPLAHVGQLGQPPDLVPVLRPVPGKRAKRHQPSKVHEISITRLFSRCQIIIRNGPVVALPLQPPPGRSTLTGAAGTKQY